MKNFTDYLEALSRANQLGEGFDVEWLFYCGMLFTSREKWWGDFKLRQLPHEGIDICWYRTRPNNKIQCFNPLTRVLSMTASRIINICTDFLGKTIVMEQESQTHPDLRVVYTYAHVTPVSDLEVGQTVQKGQTIATVCDTRKNPLLPPHLHFSCFELTRSIPERHLDWNIFSDIYKVKMIHPLFL